MLQPGGGLVAAMVEVVLLHVPGQRKRVVFFKFSKQKITNLKLTFTETAEKVKQ